MCGIGQPSSGYIVASGIIIYVSGGIKCRNKNAQDYVIVLNSFFTYVGVWTLTETRIFVQDGYVCSTR